MSKCLFYQMIPTRLMKLVLAEPRCEEMQNPHFPRIGIVSASSNKVARVVQRLIQVIIYDGFLTIYERTSFVASSA